LADARYFVVACGKLEIGIAKDKLREARSGEKLVKLVGRLNFSLVLVPSHQALDPDSVKSLKIP
jgi:hypothetical protein